MSEGKKDKFDKSSNKDLNMTQQERQLLKTFLATQVERSWVVGELAAGADIYIMAILLAEVFLRVYLPNSVEIKEEDQERIRKEARTSIRKWLEAVVDNKTTQEDSEKERFLSQFKTLPTDKAEAIGKDLLRQMYQSKSARERVILKLRFAEVVGRQPTQAELRAAARELKRKKGEEK